MFIRRFAYIAALCVLLCPSIASAQQAAPFGEVLEVRVTNVDVVATDRNGQPVSGLKPADFEVYEDGKRQDITHFYEAGGSGASAVLLREGSAPIEVPAPQSSRKFIFYFDDGTLDLGNRQKIFPAVRKFLGTQLHAGDEAMLVTWNRQLNVRVPWTTDLAAVDETLRVMAGELPGASQVQAAKQDAMREMQRLADEAGNSNNSAKPFFDTAERLARFYAEAYQHDAKQSTQALARLLASLAGVDGKKILVIATESLPTFAGAEVFEYLEMLRGGGMVNAGTVLTGTTSGSRNVNMSRFNLEPTLQVLARAANATGVTIYGINPKGLSGPASGKTEQQNPTDVSIEFAESNQVLSGINLLASRTGGVAMIGAPADMALERVSRDLDAYYSLGYRSRPGSSPERKIEVRSKRPGVRVRSRTNVYHRSMEREMADRVIANHLQSKPANELRVSLEADPVTTDGSRRLLPVRVVIPVNMLTLLPDGQGGVTGGFSVFTCSGDGAGKTSGVNVQSQAIHFTAEQAAQMKGRRIGFAIQVPVEKDRHQVSVGVLDHVSQEQGFATLKAAL